MVTDNEVEPLTSDPKVATVLVESVDNPPVLDLNGPSQPGRNHNISFTENSPIQVGSLSILHSLSPAFIGFFL